MFSKIEREFERQFGKNHPSVFTVKSNKAKVYSEMEKYVEAARILKEVENYEQANKKSSLVTRREMLRCLTAAKHLTLAADVYAKLNRKGQEDFELTLAKNNYAIALLNARNFDMALKVFQEVEGIMMDMKMPKNHPALLNTKQNIGTALHQLGKQDEASKLFDYVKQMRDMKI